MAKYHRDTGPKWIILKYSTHCAETDQPLPRGARALWYPRTRRVYAEDSRTAADWNTTEYDRAVLGAEY